MPAAIHHRGDTAEMLRKSSPADVTFAATTALRVRVTSEKAVETRYMHGRLIKVGSGGF